MKSLHSFMTGGLEINVYEMCYDDVVEWQKYHQPIAQGLKSVDANWNWYYIYIMAHTINFLTDQKIKAYCVRAEGLIIGLFVIAYNYPCNKDDQFVPIFLWYVTKSGLVQELEFLVGKAVKINLMEIVYATIKEDMKNYYVQLIPYPLWLHAARNGEKKLFDFYTKKLNFTRCQLQKESVSIRQDDGRYLYLASKYL